MLAKFKNLLHKPLSRPVAIIALVIIAVLATIPVAGLLVLINDWLDSELSYLLTHLPPKLLFRALPALLSTSYITLLLQHFFSAARLSSKLLKRILIVTLIELGIYFWYTAWWGDYLYRDFYGGFGSLPAESQMEIITAYMNALIKIVILTGAAIVIWLFFKKRNKKPN